MGVDEAQLILDYVIDTKKSISLDIFEAEFYDAALVVQPLVGNLVYYSNFGKYEPRLAESWERISPNSWRFKVRSGLKCEDGEVIDAQSFKKSLERMILHSIKKGGSPIFSRLSGFSEFVRTGRTLDGIVAQDSFLSFNFDKPLSGGLVEVLSFAPYGYICAGNLTSDGQWKDPSKFISSGPYRITSFESGVRYQLELRSEWEMFARPRAPRLVNITQSIPASIVAGRSTVVDSHAALDPIPKGTEQFELVPEYLNAILLGNLDVGYFSLLQNRESFRSLIAKYRDRIPSKLGIHNRSSSFYSNVYAPSLHKGVPNFTSKPQKPLLIEGAEPTTDSWKYLSWQTLKSALDEAGFDYKFAGNDEAWGKLRSRDFDLRLRATSVGGSADVWGIDVIFCSMIGPNYPDPSGKICELVKRYQDEEIDQVAFEKEFLATVDEAASIIPISHIGRQLYLSPQISRESLSPTLVVMRFDQVELK